MKKPIGIIDAEYFLPGDAIDISTWGRVHGVEQKRIEALKRNGCRYFYDGTDYSDSSLVNESVARLWKKLPKSIKVEEIGLIVHARTQVFSIPAPPISILQNLKNTFQFQPDFDMSICQLACASVYKAMEIGIRYLENPDARPYVLVVTSDRVFGSASHRIRQSGGIQSDGAAAVLLGRKFLKSILVAPKFYFDSRLHRGPLYEDNSKLIAQTCWRDSANLIKEYLDLHPSIDKERLKVLPINADLTLWKIILKTLKMPESQLFSENIYRRGHACSNDFIINLSDIGLANLEKGNPVLSFGQSNLGVQGCLVNLPKTGKFCEVKREG
ncbi:MAG: hypothetical protein HRU19_07160 [Pseudobacteriovorax sp.]|nr:hypothetical protein [Pseudobacteriovorax sp.]